MKYGKRKDATSIHGKREDEKTKHKNDLIKGTAEIFGKIKDKRKDVIRDRVRDLLSEPVNRMNIK